MDHVLSPSPCVVHALDRLVPCDMCIEHRQYVLLGSIATCSYSCKAGLFAYVHVLLLCCAREKATRTTRHRPGPGTVKELMLSSLTPAAVQC